MLPSCFSYREGLKALPCLRPQRWRLEMKYLASILLLYTVLMLAVHFSTWHLLTRWYGPSDSWVKRRLPPLRLLRIEALYWLLALAAWQLWSLRVKVVVGSFAAIHLVVWLAAELRSGRVAGGGLESGPRRPVALAITAFDFVEAFALASLGFLSAAFLFRG